MCFFLLLKTVYGFRELSLSPEVQRCFQKIIEQTFSRESWVTDRIYLCDGKKLEFPGTLQGQTKTESFKPKIR